MAVSITSSLTLWFQHECALVIKSLWERKPTFLVLEQNAYDSERVPHGGQEIDERHLESITSTLVFFLPENMKQNTTAIKGQGWLTPHPHSKARTVSENWTSCFVRRFILSVQHDFAFQNICKQHMKKALFLLFLRENSDLPSGSVQTSHANRTSC